MLFVGTNALLAKVKGKSQMKPADCAASTLLTANPITAEIHEKAKLVSRSSPAAASQDTNGPCGRKPTSRPTVHITATTNVLRAMSAMVRPVRTADLAIGRERKRATRPRRKAVARPMAGGGGAKVEMWRERP